ncbi:hypothetical protein [Flavonifractor plautii]|uniref:hypothetical protein n=1 Tax=Flavonifractor plautii TaxID=292800 RepID=UPI0024B9D923|nr:hypothetical protein [Flavonifractor plautii]
MKTGKRILSCLFALSICAAMSVVAFAASESIDNGSGSWYGGIDNHTIYSKVWDHVVDGRRYNVTVWVQDDNGDKDSVTGTTNGVDAAGEVKVTKTASYDHIFTPNKAGYKDLTVMVTRSGMADMQLAADTSSSFEVELWDEMEVSK